MSKIYSSVDELQQYIKKLEKEHPEVNEYLKAKEGIPMSYMSKQLEHLTELETDLGFTGGVLYQVSDLFFDYVEQQDDLE